MAFVIQDRESRYNIDAFATMEEAEAELKRFENDDIAMGVFKEDFYEIVEVTYYGVYKGYYESNDYTWLVKKVENMEGNFSLDRIFDDRQEAIECSESLCLGMLPKVLGLIGPIYRYQEAFIEELELEDYTSVFMRDGKLELIK